MKIQNAQNLAINTKNAYPAGYEKVQNRPADKNEDAVFEGRIKSKAAKFSQLAPDSAARVMRAKALLQAGELDTPANIKAAAVNLLKFGL